ncbi:hypothetical protein [Maricaulis sp.]|uniref:hypothetical protein n=1 Tax=Maricaulis sp. TaxID=1486257 RepID=UPI00329A1DE9
MSVLFRVGLSVAAVAFLSPGATALQTDPVDDVLACRSVVDIEARLACFDASAERLATARHSGDIVIVEREDVEAVERDSFGFNLPSLPRFRLPSLMAAQSEHDAVAELNASGIEEAPSTSSTSSQPSATAVAPEPQSASELDGNEVRVVERDRDGNVDTVTMRIDRTRVVGYDTTVFYMANGQVWRQVDDGEVRLWGNGPHFAEIRRGAMGSYLLRIDGDGRAIRVRREQ